MSSLYCGDVCGGVLRRGMSIAVSLGSLQPVSNIFIRLYRNSNFTVTVKIAGVSSLKSPFHSRNFMIYNCGSSDLHFSFYIKGLTLLTESKVLILLSSITIPCRDPRLYLIENTAVGLPQLEKSCQVRSLAAFSNP
jgi:hypothetical protein